MRRGEILGLCWDEVDIDKGEISITGTLKELRKVLPSGQAVVVLKKRQPKDAGLKAHSWSSLACCPGNYAPQGVSTASAAGEP